jgi:hypothetical protein
MAKSQTPGKVEKYPHPTRFGSHASMMVKDNGDGTVVCADEFGEYITEKIRLDNGSADPNRYQENRLGPLFGGKKEEVKQ